VAVAQDPVPDGGDPDGTTEPEYELQNETQTDKANRLSEASGVPVQDIIKMRLGIRDETTGDPPDGTDGLLDETTEEEEGPQGRGWGIICKWLGLHPSILGQGHYKDLSAATGESGDGILAARQKIRKTRLRGEKHGTHGATRLLAKVDKKTKQKDILVAQANGKAKGKNKSFNSSKGKSDGGKAKGKGKGKKDNRGKSKGKGKKK